MAKDKQVTSNSQAKVDTTAQKWNTPVKDQVKPKAEAKAPAKAKAEDKLVVFINDISSPSLEVFNLKEKGKIHAVITRKELEAMGLPVWDEAKFAKRNNFTAHVKHRLMEELQAGAFKHRDITFGWAQGAEEFPKTAIVPPVAKKPTTSSTSDHTPDLPVDLGDLKYGN